MDREETREDRIKVIERGDAFASLGGTPIKRSERAQKLVDDYIDGKISHDLYTNKLVALHQGKDPESIVE